MRQAVIIQAARETTKVKEKGMAVLEAHDVLQEEVPSTEHRTVLVLPRMDRGGSTVGDCTGCTDTWCQEFWCRRSGRFQ